MGIYPPVPSPLNCALPASEIEAGLQPRHLCDQRDSVMVHICELFTKTFNIQGVFTYSSQVGISSSKPTDDIQRLILEYFEVIYDSPSHSYHSALPFAPELKIITNGAHVSGS